MNNRLNQFLAAENLTQAEFAKRLGIARAGVSHILQGRNSPSYSFILAMMNSFPALNIEWLISGKGKMYKEQKSQIAIDSEPLTANLKLDTSDGMLFPVAEDDENNENHENSKSVVTDTATDKYQNLVQHSTAANNYQNAGLQDNGVADKYRNLAQLRQQGKTTSDGAVENSSTYPPQNLPQHPRGNSGEISRDDAAHETTGQNTSASIFAQKAQSFSKEIKKIVVFFSDNTFEEFKGI